MRLFGITSALLSLCAFVPYASDTLRGRTQPQRASWLIWSVLGSIALGSQIFEGASTSLWFATIQVGGTILILFLAVLHGAGPFLKRGDRYVLAAAACGLLLWMMTDTAAYALAITITISLLGGLVTIRKAYRDPRSETMVTWFCSFVAAGFAILSVGQVDLVLMAYPMYLLVLNGAIVAAMMLGRARMARPAYVAI
ncbi:hypothetical protein [Thalassococcus sp. S3]|uniref:hypothetical protein n=1 Tax=Thalassococcus sp. S3 TaxID=2017482 RepID=UPI0010240DE1|nr:hypothetical protein [Thalassococcus sp. S3]QBF30128.1 hypothetical protein CFI11_02695 [Thalassococcus sp. S3]